MGVCIQPVRWLMTIGRTLASLMLAVTVNGCDRPEDPAIDVIATGQAWAESASVRRQSLEASLVNPDNAYSRLRLAYYDEENWGALGCLGIGNFI